MTSAGFLGLGILDCLEVADADGSFLGAGGTSGGSRNALDLSRGFSEVASLREVEGGSVTCLGELSSIKLSSAVERLTSSGDKSQVSSVSVS